MSDTSKVPEAGKPGFNGIRAYCIECGLPASYLRCSDKWSPPDFYCYVHASGIEHKVRMKGA